MITKMKLALAATAALALGAIGVAGAQGRDDVHGDFAAKRAEMKQKMLEKFDTNRDGKLDDGERIVMRDTMAVERFQKLDTDGNGSLSLQEFKAARAFGKHHRGKFGHGRRGMGGRDHDRDDVK
jgi:hypothetical protein